MRRFRTLTMALLAIPVIALASTASAGHRGHHGGGYGYDYAPPAFCAAVAFRNFGNGPRIRGTRAVARAKHPRRACRKAIRRCYSNLRYVPHGRRAECLVVRSSY